MQGCVHAHMREECACVVSDPASSPPWKPSGWLASTANTQALVLLVLLLLNPLLPYHWLLSDHQGFTSTRDTAIPQKQLLSSPDAKLWVFVVSKAS